jgi:alpha-beta hydrolase superfamily lysophospholipase
MSNSIYEGRGRLSVYCESPNPSGEHFRESIVIVPGHVKTAEYLAPLAIALSCHGFNAVTYEYEKEVMFDKDPIVNRASVVCEVLDTLDRSGGVKDNRFHLVAHSLGSAVALLASMTDPNRFKSVTLLQPAGITSKQSIPKLMAKTSRKIVKNYVRARRGQREGENEMHGHYVAAADTESAVDMTRRTAFALNLAKDELVSQPVLAFREGGIAGKYCVLEDLKAARDCGISVHVVMAASDEFFAQKNINPSFAEFASSWTSVADPFAQHDTSWLQPNRTANIISQLISQS